MTPGFAYRCAAFALLLPALAGAAGPGRPERAFVVIVANNRSLTPGVAPLRFADDDGARWYEMLQPTAARISLFAVLDEESQRLFRDAVRVAEAPTRAALLRRLADYNAEMERARAEGAEPVLYLVVVGHGEVAPDGEGYVSMLDAPLRRGDLFREVIAPSKATFNHLIVDACNAYLLVSRRGGDRDDRGPSGEAAIRRYVATEELERYPGTGVLLSTSRAKATHEWSEVGGGIFSHQVRSALAGAADVNGDGRIEYSEVRAYVAAANLRIDDPRARLDVFVRPPALDRSRPLVDLAAARFSHFLRVPPSAAGHYHLEDARGVRYADFHKTAEGPLLLALVPASHYYLRDEASEVRLRLDGPGTIDVAAASFTPRALAARGAIEESFHRHLFEAPFGPAFYRGFVASTGDPPVAEGAPRFLPPGPPAAASGALDRRLAGARGRIAALGLARGDDPFTDLLIDWAARRLLAGDQREADRAIGALESRLADEVIDRPLVERKIQRIRAGAAGRALGDRLSRARALLDQGEVAAANRILNEIQAPPDPR